MKKIFVFLLSLLMITGCSSTNSSVSTNSVATPETEEQEDTNVDITTLKILSASGAPSSILLQQLQDSNNIEVVPGSDILSSALMACSVDPNYDVIIAPINLGVKANCGDDTTYKLAGVVTWGNLYVVGTSEHSDELLAFGQNAVPGLILSHYDQQLYDSATWVSSATDVQNALLAGESDYALLAQPAVSATIAKAKSQGIELEVLADLQSLSDDNGYAQAAIFVSNNIDANVYEAWLDNIQVFVNELNQDTSLLENYSDVLETAGLPSNVNILQQAFSQMNVDVQDINNPDTYEKVSNDLKNYYNLNIENAVIYSK